ncbi:DNA polymerase III [Patescibacteria group bacterium]|nr:DNA polymerase III [Patescibacteria group bacterium]
MTNLAIAGMLRNMAAAYEILGENRFRTIAYERAADSIEHLTSEVKDLWEDDKLSVIPGVGPAIRSHLDELFRTGHVRHIEATLKRVPEAVFPLLLVPGLGPKKAYKLVKALDMRTEKRAVSDLETAAKAHAIAPLEGFGEKSEQDILSAIAIYRKGQIKENRMGLPQADAIARDIIAFLQKGAPVREITVLGSLRRQVATIGDIDIAVATGRPADVISRFLSYPHQKMIEKGPTGASLLLHNGRQADLRVQDPRAYGAMLQYFTGSKNHNIALRTWALGKGLSLSEYGIKQVKTGKTTAYATEEAFYRALGLPWIPPELREDRGELEAAIRQAQGKPDGLPDLVGLSDIKGDLHIHSDYDLEPSHDLGRDSLAVLLDRAVEQGYRYIGLSDHNPSVTNHTPEDITAIMKRRKAFYEKAHAAWQRKHTKAVGIFILCEVDILTDGTLALPESAFTYVDGVIASIHSSFTQPEGAMTKRVVRGLTAHPKVRIFGHPTGRLLPDREGIALDWKEMFRVCKARGIALEINAHPARLDLPDTIVFDARRQGLKFIIDSDAHEATAMDVMRYGVSVARRGWAGTHDVLNSMEYNDLAAWLTPSRI